MDPVATQRHPVILAVDDEADDLKLINMALEGQSVKSKLVTALGGADALVQLQTQKPDLVLLDINMPDMNGQKVLQEIRKSKDSATLPVVMFSTSSSQDDVKLAYQNKANGYIRKPSTFFELEEVLSTLLKHWFVDALVPSSPEAGGT